MLFFALGDGESPMAFPIHITGGRCPSGIVRLGHRERTAVKTAFSLFLVSDIIDEVGVESQFIKVIGDQVGNSSKSANIQMVIGQDAAV